MPNFQQRYALIWDFVEKLGFLGLAIIDAMALI